MIDIRPFSSLGAFRNEWLNAKHHFSFGHYRDPKRMGFGRLRVWNDDEIAASSLLAGGRRAHGRREVSGFGRRVWIRINVAAGFAALERMAIGGAASGVWIWIGAAGNFGGQLRRVGWLRRWRFLGNDAGHLHGDGHRQRAGCEPDADSNRGGHSVKLARIRVRRMLQECSAPNRPHYLRWNRSAFESFPLIVCS